MRITATCLSALALTLVALLATLLAPLGPVNTLQLVEAASREYSFPREDGTREYLTLREDLLGVQFHRGARR